MVTVVVVQPHIEAELVLAGSAQTPQLVLELELEPELELELELDVHGSQTPQLAVIELELVAELVEEDQVAVGSAHEAHVGS